jgi:hypothetical protein
MALYDTMGGASKAIGQRRASTRDGRRMLSVVATCRQQNRNVLELLTARCRARLDGSGNPFVAARRSRIGARLRGESLATAVQKRPQPLAGGVISARFPTILGILGKQPLAIVASVATLKAVPFELVARRAPGLKRLPRGIWPVGLGGVAGREGDHRPSVYRVFSVAAT